MTMMTSKEVNNAKHSIHWLCHRKSPTPVGREFLMPAGETELEKEKERENTLTPIYIERKSSSAYQTLVSL